MPPPTTPLPPFPTCLTLTHLYSCAFLQDMDQDGMFLAACSATPYTAPCLFHTTFACLYMLLPAHTACLQTTCEREGGERKAAGEKAGRQAVAVYSVITLLPSSSPHTPHALSCTLFHCTLHSFWPDRQAKSVLTPLTTPSLLLYLLPTKTFFLCIVRCLLSCCICAFCFFVLFLWLLFGCGYCCCVVCV